MIDDQMAGIVDDDHQQELHMVGRFFCVAGFRIVIRSAGAEPEHILEPVDVICQTIAVDKRMRDEDGQPADRAGVDDQQERQRVHQGMQGRPEPAFDFSEGHLLGLEQIVTGEMEE